MSRNVTYRDEKKKKKKRVDAESATWGEDKGTTVAAGNKICYLAMRCTFTSSCTRYFRGHFH